MLSDIASRKQTIKEMQASGSTQIVPTKPELLTTVELETLSTYIAEMDTMGDLLTAWLNGTCLTLFMSNIPRPAKQSYN